MTQSAISLLDPSDRALLPRAICPCSLQACVSRAPAPTAFSDHYDCIAQSPTRGLPAQDQPCLKDTTRSMEPTMKWPASSFAMAGERGFRFHSAAKGLSTPSTVTCSSLRQPLNALLVISPAADSTAPYLAVRRRNAGMTSVPRRSRLFAAKLARALPPARAAESGQASAHDSQNDRARSASAERYPIAGTRTERSGEIELQVLMSTWM